ncbi:putative transporter [Yarrowia sp. C11]|nr:putative transporter [Yarrowia sp. E02]KAG5369028.1 putative transporter [Yarrowia sp. C11]
MSKKDQFSVETQEINSSASSVTYADVQNGAGTNQNPFSDPKVAQQFRDLYEKSQYECRHLFDPDFEWTEAEEKRVKRKLEWRVTGWACIMFMALQIDRANLGQALADNFLDDLNLTTNDYNYGNTIFLVSFMSAEIPSQLISKRLGPDRWIPTQICMWSIVAMCQGALSGRASFFVTRCLIGLIEGGFIPDLVLWLSYFYKSKELPIRLSFFWTTLYLCNILTSLLAFGLLRIRAGGLQGWRWLFIIEGFITLCIGVTSFFRMPASAAQTKTRFRKKGWFTDREEKIVVNRVLRDDPFKGDFHNRQAITPKNLWQCLSDYHMWPIYAMGLLIYIGSTPVTQYMTLTLRQMGFSPFNTNLMTIPPSVIRIVFLLLSTWLSEKFNQRALFALCEPIWTFGGLLALRFYSGALTDIWGTYVILILIIGSPYVHAILVSWASRNSNTVAQRTISAAMYNMCVQAGNVIASNIYRKDDAPQYYRGNTQLVAISAASIVLVLLVKVYYVAVNRHRDNKWNAMSKEEKAEYKATTKDIGSRRLDFRFAH